MIILNKTMKIDKFLWRKKRQHWRITELWIYCFIYLLITIYQWCEKLHQSNSGVQHDGINNNVLLDIKEMHSIDVWKPSVEMVVSMTYIEHPPWVLFKVQAILQKMLKYLILKVLMNSLTSFILVNEFLLPLLVCKGDIEHFIPLMIAHMECSFHFQYVYLKSRPHNRHGNHKAQWNKHSSLVLWWYLMLFRDLHNLKLYLALEELYGCLLWPRS